MNIKKNYPQIIFWALFVLAILLRARTLYDFCFLVSDNDQDVLWAAANDMHHFVFHEPCFYGQAYNPLVEPLLAQPFLLLGIPLRIAMPLVSGLLGFLPYVLIGWGCYKHKKYVAASFAFAFLLWLPLQFQVITSIPRGYIPACAFASVGIYLALFTENRIRIFWFVYLGFTSVVISQNSAFLVVPVGFYLFLRHFIKLRFYIQGVLGLIATLPLPLLIYWFYHAHAAYNMHLIELNFDFDSFQETLKQTDLYFNFISPLSFNKLYTIIGFFTFFTIICVLKKKFIAALSIMAGLAFFLFALSFDKSQDGTESVFYSVVRIFLGVPVSFIVFSFWAEEGWAASKFYPYIKSVSLGTFLIVSIFCFFERNYSFKTDLYKDMRKPGYVISDWVVHTQQLCTQVGGFCKQYHTSLVILDSAMVDVDYMAPALNYSFTPMIPDYERRTWVMQQEDTTVRDCFIYMPTDENKMRKYIPQGIRSAIVNKEPTVYLIQTDGRKVFDILKAMKLDVRGH